jgi:uncharacterized protein
MITFFQLQGLEFEWDAQKAQNNALKHGVEFEEAAEVFFDPFYQGGEASFAGERRDFVLGYSLAQRML